MHAHYLLLCIMRQANSNFNQGLGEVENEKSLGMLQGSW